MVCVEVALTMPRSKSNGSKPAQVGAPWRSRIVGYSDEPVDQLLANPHNWRIHGKAQQEALAGVLREVGVVQNVLVNRSSGHVVDGHLRITLAMRDNQPTVPVTWVELSEVEEALVLATLDPLSAMASADAQKLDELLRDVHTSEEAVSQMLADLAAEAGLYADKAEGADTEAQTDKAEELRERWQTQPGQLWELPSKSQNGKSHRLLCGDCRNPNDLRRACDGKVQGVFTSPPYAEQRKEQYGGVPADQYVDWWEAVQANVRDLLLADGSFFVNIKPHCEDGERHLYVLDLVCAMKRRWGWGLIDEFAWIRPAVPGAWRNRLRNEWEPVYQFAPQVAIKFRPVNAGHLSKDVPRGRGGMTKSSGGNWSLPDDIPMRSGLALPANVIQVARRDEEALEHAGAFPAGLPTFFLLAYSDPGDTWLDPFMGSGTVFIAAENNARLAVGVELLPKYVAVILQRWVAHTGLSPVLADA